jgi:hypothetical protein
MNQNVLWFVIVVVAVTIISVYKTDDISFASLLAVVLLFSVVELYTNYPLIWRDIFLHGSAVKAINEQAYIGGAWWKYPETNPGFFLLWSIFTITTSMDIVQSNIFVLLPAASILLVILILCIFRRLSIRAANAATLLAFLLTNFNTNEFMYMHFNTRLLAFVYVLLFLSIFLRRGHLGATIGLLLTGISLITSHILISLVPIVFVGLMLFSRLRSSVSRMLFLSLASVYGMWNLYIGQNLLASGLESLFNVYYLQLALGFSAQYSPLVAKSEPFFGSILTTYYKILLVILALISVYCVVRYRKETMVATTWAYLLAVAIVFGLSFFSVLTWISVDRGVIMISIALAALPALLFMKKDTGSRHWTRKLFVVLILLLIVPQFVLVHEPSVVVWGSESSSQQMYSFLVDHRGGQDLASLSDFPISYAYFEPFYQGYQYISVRNLNQEGNVTRFFLTRSENTLKIVDRRRDVGYVQPDAYAQWNYAVYSKLDQQFNVVYNSGFETIYG